MRRSPRLCPRALTGVIDKLLIYPRKCRRTSTSSRVFTIRSACAGAHAGRRVTRGQLPPRAAQRDEDLGTRRGFPRLAEGGPEVSSRIPASELEAMFDLGYHFKHVDTIFARVFGEA